MIQQVSYRGEESLIIDEKTSPIDLLTKSSRITGAIKATPGSVHQLLTLNGLWKESKASAYQQIRDQIHINVHSDPFLSRMDQNLGEQLRNAQKIQNKKQESELSEQIQALREQRDNGKIIIMNYCLMPFVEKTSGSQVEISCDQSARINLIVQRNGANVDYVCWLMTVVLELSLSTLNHKLFTTSPAPGSNRCRQSRTNW